MASKHRIKSKSRAAYLLLFHELGIRAVIDHILSENRGCENGVDILGADVLELAVQDELVTGRSHVYGCLLSEENEGKDVAMLQGPS
jgi:hypothetical protein